LPLTMASDVEDANKQQLTMERAVKSRMANVLPLYAERVRVKGA